jgi:hypothetical protein
MAGEDDVLANNSDADILRMVDDGTDGNDETDGESAGDADEITFSDAEADADAETDDESENESGSKNARSKNEEAGDDEPDADPEPTGNGEIGDYSPVPRAELLKAYPDIFKRFPQIQNTFGREEAFTELFPTVEDAQNAADYQESFLAFEQNIASGDPTHLLQSVKNLDPNIFGKFTGNFMDTLYKVDRDQFNEVLRPITKKLVRHIFADGVRTKNENLVNAAQWFSDYLFGTEVEKIPADQKPITTKTKEQEDFERRREEHTEREYNTSFTEVLGYVDRKLDTFLSNIDPNNKLTPYTKRVLVRDIKEEVGAALRKETPLQRTIGNLWGRGKKFGYTPELRQKIGNLYLARAKQVAPAIAKRLVKEAMGTSGPKPTIKKTNIASGGRPSANGNNATKTASSKAPDPKQIDWSKSSDGDILRGKATVRK